MHQFVVVPITSTALSRLPLVVDQFWRQAVRLLDPIPDVEVQHAVLAATMEIAENIVRYAYPISNPEHWLRVEFYLFGDRVEVILSDEGRAFESMLADPAHLSALWDQPERDGWGLLLAQKVVDEFSYTRTNEVNRWRLVKSIRPLATKLAKTDDSRCGQELSRMDDAG